MGMTQIGNSTSMPRVNSQSIRHRPVNMLMMATGSDTRIPTPEARQVCSKSASPLIRVIRSPVVARLKKGMDNRLRLLKTVTRRSLITRSLAQARQYAPRNFEEPRKPTNSGNTSSPPMICSVSSGAPIFGSHGSSVLRMLSWIEAAVSVNQFAGRSPSGGAVLAVAASGGTRRSSMVLVAHRTSPFDAPKRIPKKTPATIRPQYGFK